MHSFCFWQAKVICPLKIKGNRRSLSIEKGQKTRISPSFMVEGKVYIYIKKRSAYNGIVFYTTDIPSSDVDTATAKSDHDLIKIHGVFLLTIGQVEFKAQADENKKIMITLKVIEK
jgi:hypothetical protein